MMTEELSRDLEESNHVKKHHQAHSVPAFAPGLE